MDSTVEIPKTDFNEPSEEMYNYLKQKAVNELLKEEMELKVAEQNLFRDGKVKTKKVRVPGVVVEEDIVALNQKINFLSNLLQR